MKVAILTSGGDCQGLNPTLRAVALTLYRLLPDVQIYGIADGYTGLIENRWRLLAPADFADILRLGGTILGTTRQPFKTMLEADGALAPKVRQMLANYQAQGFAALVVLGGNGSQKTANLLWEQGVNLVFVPKTIDNDILGTDRTFGFDSAVAQATAVLDAIQTTAQAHARVFVVELMGQKAGWIALQAGVAGGADAILIPEIAYETARLVELLATRQAQGLAATLIAIAEGARSKEELAGEGEGNGRLSGSAGERLVGRLKAALKNQGSSQEVKLMVAGYLQRGGTPTATDRLLCSRLGVKAAELVAERRFGYMVAERGPDICALPLAEVAGRLKLLSADSPLLQAAKQLGIVFGD